MRPFGDFQLRMPPWTMGKYFEHSAPPDVVPPQAHGLRIQGRLNG
jgi:acylpyruvate hydrolase